MTITVEKAPRYNQRKVEISEIPDLRQKSGIKRLSPAAHNIARQRRSRTILGVFRAIWRDFKKSLYAFGLSTLGIGLNTVFDRNFEI